LWFLDLAQVAQLVEHILGKDEVTSSILVLGSIKLEAPGFQTGKRKAETQKE
jgi:hypothetical protein